MKRSQTSAIILAAGGSTRMGHPKQLIKWHGKTLLNHVIEKTHQANLSPTIIVLGAHRKTIENSIIQNPQNKIIVNHNWQNGLSTSVKEAIKNLPENIKSVIIFLADQPQVKFETINSLIDKSLESDADVIIPIKDGKKGNPILIKSTIFDSIDQLKGDQGFRQIINSFSQDYIESNDNSIFLDIDFESDIEELNKYNNANQ